MNNSEREAFNKANEKVHPVETQWHFKYVTKYGFVPVTKEAVGFVRSYTYEHPSGRRIVCNTGVSCDYWCDPAVPSTSSSLWGELEPYLKSLSL